MFGQSFSIRIMMSLAIFLCIPVRALEPQTRALTGDASGGQAQFRFLPVENQDLVPVRVLGAVRRPGIHYVPKRIGLIDLITLAGGAGGEARLDKVSVLKADKPQSDGIIFDAKTFLEGDRSAFPPILENNDIVYIPEKQPFIDRDVATTLGFIGSITSVLLSILIIRREVTR